MYNKSDICKHKKVSISTERSGRTLSKHLPPKKNKHEQPEERSLLNTPLRERRTSHVKNELAEPGKKNIVFIAPAALLLLLGFVLPLEGWLEIVIFAAAFLLAGFQVILRAADEAMGLKLLEADLLVLLSCVLSFALSNWAGAALLMVCYRCARLVEGYAAQKMQDMNVSLSAFVPEFARLITERGSYDEVEPEKVAEEDVLEVRPGEIIPVDGYVLEGVSAVDASPLTGISSSRSIVEGSPVWSGCLNSNGIIKMKAERIYAESTASQLSHYLERASRYKTKAEKLALKIERYFTPAAVALAFVSAVIIPLFSGEWAVCLGRAAVILAVSSCSSLAISLSHCLSAAGVWAARRGIIFKGNCFFETMGTAQTFVFNKTGTLTEGRYVVTEIVPEGMSNREFLTLAAQVESLSDHPIARAICWAHGPGAGTGLNISCEEYEGRGVVAKVNNTEVLLGNPILLGEYGIECTVTPRDSTAIHMAVNGVYAGYMLLSDKIRDSAFDQLEALRIRGVKNMVALTADMRSVARPLASSLNMDMVRAELSAEGKVSAVEYLMATKAEHSTLAFVSNGDGDPETLKRADVGVSFGALGHDAAFELADVLLLEARLSALAETVGISKAVCRAELISLAVCAAVKLLLVVLALAGIVGIIPAALTELVLTAYLYLSSVNIINYDDNRRIKR